MPKGQKDVRINETQMTIEAIGAYGNHLHESPHTASVSEWSNKGDRAVLSISLSTVKNHEHSVLCKLGGEHRFQAARKFRSLDDLPR
jgi:hypothetical protein